ncbi:MAG: hypothetical protein ABFS02_02025 [Pseudomonadota bacterium]
MTTLCIELVKGGFMLASVALGAGIGFFFYFRQKEYELTKQRYLEQGIDIVASGLETALGIVSHNYARSLGLCRHYRDLGAHFQAKELERGFLELNSSTFYQTAQYRVDYLLQDQVVWEVFQSALAHASTANTFIAQEIPDALRIVSAEPEGQRDRCEVVEDMMKRLQDMHDAGFKYASLGHELHVLGQLLEETRLSRKAVAAFHMRKEVQAVIARLREAFPRSPEIYE